MCTAQIVEQGHIYQYYVYVSVGMINHSSIKLKPYKLCLSIDLVSKFHKNGKHPGELAAVGYSPLKAQTGKGRVTSPTTHDEQRKFTTISSDIFEISLNVIKLVFVRIEMSMVGSWRRSIPTLLLDL